VIVSTPHHIHLPLSAQEKKKFVLGPSTVLLQPDFVGIFTLQPRKIQSTVLVVRFESEPDKFKKTQ